MSVENSKSGKIGGYIRIRSKAQGVALSLGDKITNYQRGGKASHRFETENDQPAHEAETEVNDEMGTD